MNTVEEEKVFLHPLWVPGWVWKLDKNRLTGEQHTHLFSMSFIWHKSLHKEMTQRNDWMVSVFVPGLMKSRQLWKDMGGQRVWNWCSERRETEQDIDSDSCLGPFDFGDRDALFSGTRGQEPSCQCRRCRRSGLIPGSGRSPGEGNANPLWDSCLEKPMDRGAWQATVYGVTKSWIRLSD